jgi:hypothetical protein
MGPRVTSWQRFRGPRRQGTELGRLSERPEGEGPTPDRSRRLGSPRGAEHPPPGSMRSLRWTHRALQRNGVNTGGDSRTQTALRPGELGPIPGNAPPHDGRPCPTPAGAPDTTCPAHTRRQAGRGAGEAGTRGGGSGLSHRSVTAQPSARSPMSAANRNAADPRWSHFGSRAGAPLSGRLQGWQALRRRPCLEQSRSHLSPDLPASLLCRNRSEPLKPCGVSPEHRDRTAGIGS